MTRYFTYLLFPFLLLAGFQQGFAASYELDDAAIDELFADAVVITAEQALVQYEAEVAMMMDEHFDRNAVIASPNDDRQLGAIVLCWFFGGIGIHRVYLGGQGSLIFIYCITFGGCGVVWLVDLIILITDGTDRFENNNRFIAW